ncbi:MAG: hypothetical protein KME32_08230 [Mojavia pulchra JT2-VF2]|jgi:hypothetical protein|uniref:Uncharacterized protein n=1 Tax=Mojavia pulchra JT2-VF2 TaxID=287848 RepID=A0A951UFH6_9NOST|nr:hypothetical protein [Mojavia pulchra JT2-VF2]
MNQTTFSNVMPIWKFCTLYIFTGGVYQLAWAHKHWKFIKERENLKIRPWFRSLFLPFYLYSLCQKVFALAEEQGYRIKHSPFRVTLFYWIFIVLSRLADPLWLISIFSFIPLLTVVKALNYYWGQQQPNLPIREFFTGREIAWIVFGVILWLLIVIGLLAGGNV